MRLKLKAWLVEQFASCELKVGECERALIFWEGGMRYSIERILIRTELAFWKTGRWITQKLSEAMR